MLNPSIAFLGNFQPSFSTENEYRDAFERIGAQVTTFQEGDVTQMLQLIDEIRNADSYDFVLWTRTRDLAARVGEAAQWRLIAECRKKGVPIVGVHLDIWISLNREAEIPEQPYFHIDLLFTADGGHQDEWADYGVEHRWLLPAISERWLGLGEPQDRFRSKIAFVGSWRGQYHPEASHRHELIKWLMNTYGRDVQFWPRPNQHAIRGRELNDLYASVDVVVGDSYLSPGGHYCSDRIPETMGRGGVLLHPRVDGINRPGDPFPTSVWGAGDWFTLENEIEILSSMDDDRRHDYRLSMINAMSTSHTYTHRAQEIIDTLTEEVLL